MVHPGQFFNWLPRPISALPFKPYSDPHTHGGRTSVTRWARAVVAGVDLRLGNLARIMWPRQSCGFQPLQIKARPHLAFSNLPARTLHPAGVLVAKGSRISATHSPLPARFRHALDITGYVNMRMNKPYCLPLPPVIPARNCPRRTPSRHTTGRHYLLR